MSAFPYKYTPNQIHITTIFGLGSTILQVIKPPPSPVTVLVVIYSRSKWAINCIVTKQPKQQQVPQYSCIEAPIDTLAICILFIHKREGKRRSFAVSPQPALFLFFFLSLLDGVGLNRTISSSVFPLQKDKRSNQQCCITVCGKVQSDQTCNIAYCPHLTKSLVMKV